jgi:hypothetical protein
MFNRKVEEAEYGFYSFRIPRPLRPALHLSGRIFGCAENRALRGSALTRSGPGCAVAKPLQSLAHEPPHPYGVSVFKIVRK